MEITSLLAFAGLCVLLSLTPGPDVFLVIRHSTRRRRSGIAVALGSATGSIAWALLVAVGLAALIEQSAEAYRAIRFLGGCYLIYLGIKTVLDARQRPDDHLADASAPLPGRGRSGGPFVAGLLSCLLNPKVGLFFLAIVPQFLPTGMPVLEAVLVLGAIDAAVAVTYFAVVAGVTAKVAATLRRPRVMQTIERASGAVLITLGVGTAAQAAAAKA